MNKDVRVRFAPSPTGPLHIGGVRTALFNYLFAKKHGGKFLLRIEDTDQTRFVEGAEEYIIEALNWCGISPNEGQSVGGEYGPYKQSERKDIYKKYAEQLIENDWAYYAFDTAEELTQLRTEAESNKSNFIYNYSTREQLNNSLNLSAEIVQQKLDNGDAFVIRFKFKPEQTIEMNDLVRGKVSVNSSDLDDKVLFKSDGLPTYHLANIVDDYLMKISHVIRGEEWLPSLPLHVMLYKALGWENEMPDFAHLPLILKPQGNGKLSKRDGDKLGFPVFPLEWKSPNGDISRGYREDGYFPEAMVNMLALLGWNPGTDKELFSLEELAELFTLERVGKSGSKFDPDKTKWFNQQYLRAKKNNDIIELFTPILKDKNIEHNQFPLNRIIDAVKDRVTFISDIWSQTFFFFEAPTEYNPKVVKKRWKADVPELLQELNSKFSKIETFNSDTIHAEVEAFIGIKEIGMGKIMNAIRLAITGDAIGPDLKLIMEILGQEESVKRIDSAIKNI